MLHLGWSWADGAPHDLDGLKARSPPVLLLWHRKAECSLGRVSVGHDTSLEESEDRVLRMGVRLVTAGLSIVRSSHRSAFADSTVRHVRWLENNLLPLEFLGRLYPELQGLRVHVTLDIDHQFELPYGERLVLAAIVNLKNPKRILEVGTFTGTTTALLADLAPQASVETIDLPDGEFVWEDWITDTIGMAFRDDPKLERITQHRINSRDFDWSPGWDLIFIDGSHEYEDVLRDSQNAIGAVSNDGLVVWDDYQAATPGVVRALNDLHRQGVEIVRVAATRLALHCPSGFPTPIVPNVQPWHDTPVRRGVER